MRQISRSLDPLVVAQIDERLDDVERDEGVCPVGNRERFARVGLSLA